MRRGRSGPKGPLTENSGREASAGFARERNSLERSKRGVGPFRASCQLQGLLWQPSAYWKGLRPPCLLAFATLRGCRGCPLISEVTWGRRQRTPPLRFCAGDGLGRRALSQKISGREESPQLQKSAPGPSLAAFCQWKGLPYLLEGFKPP